jgi:hypothetical protein
MLRRQVKLDAAFELLRTVMMVSLGLFAIPSARFGVVQLCFVVVWFAIALRFALRGIWWLLMPRRHWLLQPMALFGDPLVIAKQIDAEIVDNSSAFVFGHIPRWRPWRIFGPVVFTALTPHWLVRFTHHYYHVVSIEPVVWVYEAVTAKSSWLGGERFEHAIALVYAGGGEERLRMGSHGAICDVLERLFQQRPELLVGYLGDYVDQRTLYTQALADTMLRRRWKYFSLSREERDEWHADLREALERFPRRFDPAHPETMRDPV